MIAADERAGAAVSGVTEGAALPAALPLFDVSCTAFCAAYTVGVAMATTFWRSASENVPEDETAEDGTVRATSVEES